MGSEACVHWSHIATLNRLAGPTFGLWVSEGVLLRLTRTRLPRRSAYLPYLPGRGYEASCAMMPTDPVAHILAQS